MKEALAVVKKTLRKMDAGGVVSPLSDNKAPFSSPSPNMRVTGSSFTADSSQPTVGELRGTINLSGSVSSWVCDITAGARGTIDSVDVFLNHGSTPIASIPVAVTKGAGQAPRKFPFSGTFSANIPVKVIGGPNTFTLTARDKVVGRVGSAEVSLECRAAAGGDPSPTNPGSGGVTYYAQPLAAEVDLTGLDVTQLEAGTASLSVTVKSLITGVADVLATLKRSAKRIPGLVLTNGTVSMTVLPESLLGAINGTINTFSATIDCPAITHQARTILFRRVTGNRFASDYYRLTIQAPSGLAGASAISATVTRGASGSSVTQSLSLNSGVWKSADNQLTMTLISSASTDGTKGVTASVTSTTLGIANYQMEAAMTDATPGQTSYSSANLASVNQSEDSAASLYPQYPILEWQDDKEEFHAYALEIEGPEAVISRQEFTVPTLSGDRHIIKSNNKWVLANAAKDSPEVLIYMSVNEGRNITNNPIREYIEIHKDITVENLQYLLGFLRGFAGGGGSFIAATGEAIADAAMTVDGHLLSVFQWIPECIASRAEMLRDLKEFGAQAGRFAGDRSLETIEAASAVAKALGGIALTLSQRQGEAYDALMIALVSGDRSNLDAVLAENLVLMEMGFEVLDELAGAYASLGGYERGEAMGRAIFEMWALLAPFSKAFQAQTLAKATALANVIAKLKQAAWLRDGPRAAEALAALDRVAVFVDKLASTRMCFVAGTSIHTINGLRAIEVIKSGDLVWSRSQQTGEFAYRPVISTMVTHPTTLHHILYRTGNTRRAHAVSAGSVVASGEEGGSDDPPGSVSELVCTGEHPFFVQEKQDFVEARSLEAGYHLVLADGLTATVVANTTETAAVGQNFTTYNFEVAEFHTYFAGEGGVWVHNAGRDCDRFFTLSQRMADRDGINLVEAAGKIEAKLPRIKHAVKHQGYSESIKSVLNGEKVPAGLDGPGFDSWLRGKLGGTTEKIKDPVTGRDLTDVDCLVGRRWMECKHRNPAGPPITDAHPFVNDTKAQLYDQWLLAAGRNQTLELVTNFDLPPGLQDWLKAHDIPWTKLDH
jgi:hypothetical protein